MAYDKKAQEFAFGFFAQGLSKEKALAAIRKEYPGFSGSTWDEWVVKLQWAERRATLDLKARDFAELCQDTAQVLMLELNEIREKLIGLIRDGKLDSQTVYAYMSTARQMSELARQHMESQEPEQIAMATLQSAIEQLLGRLRQISELAKPLEQHASAVGKIVEEIAEEFGREATR